MSDLLSITGIQPPEIPNTVRLGQEGEAIAAAHLAEQGYRMVMFNFKVPVGRNTRGVQVTGEIDLIALDEQTLVFAEVKTRRSDDFLPIATAVDLRKKRQITRTARVYRRLFNLIDMPYRFDVITVLMPEHTKHRVEHLKDFWSEASFRKRAWLDQNLYA